jgi:hypothetical protein
MACKEINGLNTMRYVIVETSDGSNREGSANHAIHNMLLGFLIVFSQSSGQFI